MPQWVNGQSRTLAEGVWGAADGWITGLAEGRSRLQAAACKGLWASWGGLRGRGQRRPGRRAT